MFVWAAISYQLQEHIHRIWMNMVHLLIQWLPYLVFCRGTLLWTSSDFLSPDPKVTQNPQPRTQNPEPPILICIQISKPWTPKIQNFEASQKKNVCLTYKNVCLTGPGAKSGPWAFRAPKPRNQNPNHWSIAFLRVSENILISFLHFSCLLQILQLIEPKKCPICWVSHMFFIWKHRFSYGIYCGSCCALQNSTQNISTPNILSFFPSTPEGLKKCIFYAGGHAYIYIIRCVYICNYSISQLLPTGYMLFVYMFYISYWFLNGQPANPSVTHCSSWTCPSFLGKT